MTFNPYDFANLTYFCYCYVQDSHASEKKSSKSSGFFLSNFKALKRFDKSFSSLFSSWKLYVVVQENTEIMISCNLKLAWLQFLGCTMHLKHLGLLIAK